VRLLVLGPVVVSFGLYSRLLQKLIAVIVNTTSLEASRTRPRKQQSISIYHCFIGISANQLNFLGRGAGLRAVGGSRGKIYIFKVQPWFRTFSLTS
jgi:hypothetical protein